MFLSLPKTVDNVRHGDSHEHQRHGMGQSSLHCSKPVANGIDHGLGPVFKSKSRNASRPTATI